MCWETTIVPSQASHVFIVMQGMGGGGGGRGDTSFYLSLSLLDHLQLCLTLDDGVEIFSANEVCRFLCGETGNEGFYGADPTHQALVDYWLGWEASELKVRVCGK